MLPLYLLNFLYGVISHIKEIKFDLTSVELFLINIFMLQIWSRHRKLVSFYNGISWFLHDLLICYFLTPLLLKGINSIKKSLIFFTFFALTRIILDEFLNHGAFNIFDTHLHDGPIVRIFEFYLGMLIIPTFLKIKRYLDIYQIKFPNFFFKMIFTIIPILSTIILYYILANSSNLFRCYFILIFCLYIFIIGFEFGYFPKIISNRIFQMIMNPQMEMYLSHISINNMIEKNNIIIFLKNHFHK